MADDEKHAPPHDKESKEPLGPFTPDDESPGGSTPEVHDTLSPHDVPKDSPNRRPIEERVAEEGGEATRGTA